MFIFDAHFIKALLSELKAKRHANLFNPVILSRTFIIWYSLISNCDRNNFAIYVLGNELLMATEKIKMFQYLLRTFI